MYLLIFIGQLLFFVELLDQTNIKICRDEPIIK